MHVDLDRTLRTPATPMQESVWWVHQRARNKSIYNLTWRLACDRAVDVEALRIAWQAMTDRHDALRTSVARVDGTVELTLLAHVAAELGRVEVDDTGSADVPTVMRLIAEEVQEREMALERAPLARLTLVSVGAEHELLLTVHHVVLDGWAVQLLLGELSTAYAAALSGRVPSFDDEPVPFHVYADELRRAAAEGRWERSLEHWRTTLEGASAATMVADRQTEAAVGAAGVTVRYEFSAPAVAGVAALSQGAMTTPFASVLAALQIVLARGGAGPDVTVGVAVANRMSARDQRLVGYTANLCIARATVEDDDTIADVVARCRDGMWAMLAHQGVPYPAVFGTLPPATQATLSDAAPVLLSYLGPIGNDLRLGDVELTLLRSPNRAARADVAMSFWDVADGHVAEIEFNTARYDPATLERLLLDIDAVLAAGGDDPRRKVASLDIGTRSVARRSSALPAPASAPAAVPDELRTSDVGQQVAAAWAELLGAPPSGPDADFFAAGGHSLGLVRLAAALEEQTGIEIDVVEWLGEPTPRRLVALLASDAVGGAGPGATTLQWLRDGAGPHLHLVHGAGGGVHDYRDLVAALPDDWRVTASQEREPLASVPSMAQRYAADLVAAGLRPDILGGWSMGGQIAYEIAAACGIRPRALAVIDSTPPVGGRLDADVEEQRASAFAATVCRSLGAELDCSLPKVEGDVELHMGALAAYLGCAGRPVPAPVLAERWHTYRRHAEAAVTYVRSGRVDAPALIVAADLWDAQIEQWTQRVARTPRPMTLRLATDHHGVLASSAAQRIAIAIVALERGLA